MSPLTAKTAVQKSTSTGKLRVLFTAAPIPGHLFPLLPLARAAFTAGDHVAVLAPGELAELIGRGLKVLPGERDLSELLTENHRRTGVADLNEHGTPAAVASLFADVRIDLSADRVLDAAAKFGPDLVVSDEFCTVGPMVAADLRVPLVQHAIGLPPGPPELVLAMDTMLAPRYAGRNLARVRRSALVDPWPQALHDPHWTASSDRLPIRALTYSGSGPASRWSLPAPRKRPRVLVTLGTVLRDRELLDALVTSVAAVPGVEVLATIPPRDGHRTTGRRITVEGNVTYVDFTPMTYLIKGVSVVVAAGSAGTILAAMLADTPMIIHPKGAEKPANAARVAAAGAGITITNPAQAATAVTAVLQDRTFRDGAVTVGGQIRRAPHPAEVWASVKAMASA